MIWILFITITSLPGHATLMHEFHDLAWRPDENEIKIQLTQNFLHQKSEIISTSKVENKIQAQNQNIELSYGITDRFDVKIDTSYQSKFFVKQNEIVKTNAQGAGNASFALSYRLIEQYPAPINLDVNLSHSPKSGDFAMGEYTNFKNGGDISAFTLLMSKRITERHEFQTIYSYIMSEAKTIRFYYTINSHTPTQIEKTELHGLQFLHNLKFKSKYALLTSLRFDLVDQIKMTIPLFTASSKEEKHLTTSLATGLRFNYHNHHLWSFILGLKKDESYKIYSNLSPDQKTQDKTSSFFQIQYSFAHQFY